MRKEYDFSNAMPNPYVKKLKRQEAVNIELPKKDFQAYKALGADYIKIMSNILSNALKQPNLLREASPSYKSGKK